MANYGTILLVSSSPGLNKILGTIASTYSLSLVSAATAKAGLVAFKQAAPDCVIFDARLLCDHKRVELVREKIESKGVPVLFLSADSPGASRTSGVRTAFSIEPAIKFVSAQSDRLKSLRPSGFWRRFTSRPGVSPVT